MTIISPNVHIVKGDFVPFSRDLVDFFFGVAFACGLGLILKALFRALIAWAAWLVWIGDLLCE